MSRPAAAISTFILAVLFALSPLLSPDFGGFDPDRFPIPQNNPPVQPEGYAFAIWGPIYLWLMIGLGFGIWKRGTDPAWHAMRLALIPSLAVGAVWLLVAVNSPVWASILIWVMLVFALIALFRSPREDGWFAAGPVGLYAGWLSAASCVSLGLLLAGYGYLEGSTAALLMVFIALVLASGVQSQLRRAPTYGIAVIWALIGVIVGIAGAASPAWLIGACVVLAIMAVAFATWRGARV